MHLTGRSSEKVASRWSSTDRSGLEARITNVVTRGRMYLLKVTIILLFNKLLKILPANFFPRSFLG